MANNERKPGESIKQGKARIKDQKRIDNIVEDIEHYGGEIEPAVLIAEQNPATISQGYQTVGRRNNNHRVGQKSVFGEREYDAHPSLAQRFGNGITDGLHLTSPPTFQDGYDRTLNAEVPTGESAQGQELKRMGKTAMTDAAIAAPFGLYQFYVNPLAMSAAVGSGALVDQGTKAVLNEVNDQLNESGKQLSENQQNAVRAAVGLFSGNKAYKWGDRATKRGLEVAMHTTGSPNPIPQIKYGGEQRNGKQRGDVVNYILTGKNNNGTSNTLGMLQGDGNPHYYTGFGYTTKPEYGRDAVRTYLYEEPLHPFKTPADQSLGVHADYVAKNYPKKKIKVYEAYQPLLEGGFRPSEEPISIGVKDANGNIGLMVGKGDEPKFDLFNAAGHKAEFGIINGEEFVREQDIGKFNGKDYMDRGLRHEDDYGILGKFPLRGGLDIADYHGTPFIVRSPWVSKEQVPIHTIDQGLRYPKINYDRIFGKTDIKESSSILSSDHDIEKYIPKIRIPKTDLSKIDFSKYLKSTSDKIDISDITK